MKVLVIGSGVIGITIAWFLNRSGHEVTVVEREEGPGLATSFANGALLTPSMPEPWNAPGSWRALLASLACSDSPLRLNLAAIPSLAGWGMRFLRNSSPPLFHRNTISNLQLALHSLHVMQGLRKETGIEYGRTARGSLKVFRDPEALDCASAWADRLACAGLMSRRLSTKETIELEPALAPIERELAGALYYQADETGDAYQFCVSLTERARDCGVELCFRTEVSSLELRAGKVVAARSGLKCFVADVYVVAAGSYSTPLLRRIGVDLPVRPAKGYSLTYECEPAQLPLSRAVIDDALHAAVVPLQRAIRVAGTAEFAGFDRTMKAARVRNLQNLLSRVLPQYRFDHASARKWCGLRPMSADGVPVIGRTSVANLFVNTGHGHLGWTMAAGSAQLLADLISGRTASIDPARFALSRFDTRSKQ